MRWGETDSGLLLPGSPVPGLSEALIPHGCEHGVCLLCLPPAPAAPWASPLSRARLGPDESLLLQLGTAAGTARRGSAARGREQHGSRQVRCWALRLYFCRLKVPAHGRLPCAFLTNSSPDFKWTSNQTEVGLNYPDHIFFSDIEFNGYEVLLLISMGTGKDSCYPMHAENPMTVTGRQKRYTKSPLNCRMKIVY